MLFEEHPTNKLSNDCSENVIIAFQSLSFHYIQILKISSVPIFNTFMNNDKQIQIVAKKEWQIIHVHIVIKHRPLIADRKWTYLVWRFIFLFLHNFRNSAI